MVLSYLDTKLVYLFYIVEPIATTSFGDSTGTPTGSRMEQLRGLELESVVPAPSKYRCAGSTGAWSLVNRYSNGAG